MIPAYMDKIRIELEETFYTTLQHTDIAKDTLKAYPEMSVEEIAKSLAQGMSESRCGEVARMLSVGNRGIPGYSAICQEAFENVVLRLLKESKCG